MPILSLPLPRLPTGIAEYLPIRVPFPFMRIASILPHAINEPIKTSLMALFRLAWSAKLQIPVLITVVFMACDIRLQLEINIFWETNNGRPHANHGSSRNAGGQRRTSREDIRRAALVASALYQQQRRRLIQEIRAQQNRQRVQAPARRPSNPLQAAATYNAPLATEEDSDLDLDYAQQQDEQSDSDTLTCSHRSTASEAGSFGSDEDETDEAEEDGNDNEPAKKKKKVKHARLPSKEAAQNDDGDDSSTDEDEDDDDDDDYEDDEYNESGGGMNGGSSSHGGDGGGGYRDNFDHDSDDSGENSQDESGGGYSSPLVVEVEIRHRALQPPGSCSQISKSVSLQDVSPLRSNKYFIYNYFSEIYKHVNQRNYPLTSIGVR